jgi:hypothetical protein
VTEFTNPALSAWESFYVIVGSSGAALIGIQFVVMTLIADMRKATSPITIGAFGTPTVVHFGGALVVAALMSAPWPSLLPPSIALALCGLGGLGYGATVIHRARRQTDYEPVGEDWLWHAILPCSMYAALALAAFLMRTTTQLALFIVGGAALVLLLIGVHNAWDTVTYMLLGSQHEAKTEGVAVPPEKTAATE